MIKSTRRAVMRGIAASPTLGEGIAFRSPTTRRGGVERSRRDAVSRGTLRIEDFGGAADWTGSTGTDNLPPLLNAIASATHDAGNGNLYAPTIEFGLGEYWFSNTIELYKIVTLRGLCTPGYHTGGGTTLVFPTNTTCVRIHSSNTAGEGTRRTDGTWALGSVIENLAIKSLGGTDTDKHGIRMRARATIRNWSLFSIPGDAINIVATSGAGGALEGNCNDWLVDNCYVHGARGNGLHVNGRDANGGACIKFGTFQDALGFGGCGILDSSALGNHYFGLEITGYGNTGVYHNGRGYVLINAQGMGGATEPGTNNYVWYDIGPGAESPSFPHWVYGTTYKLTQPIMTFGGPCTFIGTYIEGGGYGHILAPAVAIGGEGNWTQYSSFSIPRFFPGPTFHNQGVGGYYGYQPGTVGYNNNGQYSWAACGAGGPYRDAREGVSVFEHRRFKDGEFSWTYGYNGHNGDLKYCFMNSKPIWEITTPSTTETFGRSTVVPHTIAFTDASGS
jgi:hypothetical protein